jgi:predicted permease
VPGVTAAGIGTSLPPTFIQKATGFAVEGAPPPAEGQPSAVYIPISPGYLQALGVPTVAGRAFDERDDGEAPLVVLVNESLARSHLGGIRAVGRRIDVDGALRTVAGVVGDVKYQGLHEPAGPQVFVPFAQAPFPGTYLAVRTPGDPAALVDPIRRAVLGVDPEHGPTHFATMPALLSESVSTTRFVTLLLALFGATALLLAAVGVYGVVSYGVARRRREIGVRVALGADPGAVLRLVLRQGAALGTLGLALGLVGGTLATRWLRSLLFEVGPGDPATLAGVSLLLLGVALLACAVPARRASRVDPVAALRAE